MKACIVIPARWGSSRFPGKPMALIAGRPLIVWTWMSAIRTGLPVFVASDDALITAAVGNYGGSTVMTNYCRNGTERCVEAVDRLWGNWDIVVNWQGDAPLMPADWALSLVERLDLDQTCDVATIATLGTPHLGSVRVESYTPGWASDFRRCGAGEPIGRLHHGIYAFRRAAGRRYAMTGPNPRELSEGLEQLRWPRVGLIDKPAPIWPIREVNYPEDLAPTANMLGMLNEEVAS